MFVCKYVHSVVSVLRSMYGHSFCNLVLMYTFSVFGHAILIHLGRHHVAHGVVRPLPECQREVESTCMDTLRSNLTRVLCFPNVIQLNVSVLSFIFLVVFLWNSTEIQGFGELEVFEKSGSLL